ncbi:50S ribosomal protein L30 [Candidatus Micrarchaeota archaeon CG11_big_fil_rev_8_21_14_0_20_47_5]|nr:MAG: hypothetical protein AUJ17_02060 [Candidatus Micrarchaeota archaeon CG1_02_47_40]PIN82759.1 MAG: 50S ribosomal protein L30 [Candidatus Micrarchaeota archaeon CG11_big_fil_rev_8_21_14_0_20_47_5]
MISVIRVRAGTPNPTARKTLELLRLTKVNHCILLEETPAIMGMVQACKDYITWGVPSEEVVKKMIAKRGEEKKAGGEKGKVKGKKEGVVKKKAGPKYPVFRLSPPRKGWTSIKRQYPEGALGKRKDMDKLLLRMI